MKGVAAAFRQAAMVAAMLIIVGSGGVLWMFREHYKRCVVNAEQRASQAFDAGVKQGLEYACTTLDPIAEEPFLIFDELTIPWVSLVPNLDVVYGPEKNPALPWTVPKLCGTFPINGPAPPGSDVRGEDENLVFSKPGEYYLRTTVGDFKILILNKQSPRDDQAVDIAAFVSKNTVASMSDARTIQPNYRYWGYFRPDKALRKFFASDQPLGFQCAYSAEFCNFVLHKRGFEVRNVWLRIGTGGAHFVSEVLLPGRGKWVALDSMYGVVFTDRRGEFLSAAEMAKVIQEHPEEVAVKDIAHKRWLKYPYGNFMHQFTWTPELLGEPCCKPETYLSMIRGYTREYWLMDYDRLFRCAKVEKFAWDGKNLVR